MNQPVCDSRAAAFVTHAPLAGADLYDWIALRRVKSGGVSTKDGRWFDIGRRIPSYVADTLAALHGAHLVKVDVPDVSGMAWAALTDVGIARYDALCRQRQSALLTASGGDGAAGIVPEDGTEDRRLAIG